mgnify:FL=1
MSMYRFDEPGEIAPRRVRAEMALERMERCDHPDHFRAPICGLMADGECRLCGASAVLINRQYQERRTS